MTQDALLILLSLVASSGVFVFVYNQVNRRKRQTELLLSLVQVHIIHMCQVHLDRRYITKREYDDLYNYFYKPYKDLGGNGLADILMPQISKLLTTDVAGW